MTGPKTNERPGTKAVLRHFHMSASKARQVLDLIRGQDVDRAAEILNNTPREAARVIAKVLASAVANAAHNDGLRADDLFVAAAFADEGPTMKRWRPRARGRATRIRKRTCHITIIVDRMDDDRIEQRLASRQAAGAQRSRRVAESQRRADQQGRGRRRDAAREAEIEAAAAETDDEALEGTELDGDVVEDTAVGTTDSETTDETTDETDEGDDADDSDATVVDQENSTDESASDESASETDQDDAEGEEKGN